MQVYYGRSPRLGKLGLLLPLLLLAACGGQLPASAPSVTQADAVATSKSDGPIASPEPDWPQWRGPRRDEISGEKNLLPTWPENGPPLAWKIGNLGRGWSSPIIVNDRLYITGDVEDDLVIFAFDLDGKLQWQAKNGKSWTGQYPGARACCAYSDGALYHMNAHGRVVCLNAATGKERWACDLLERFQTDELTWGFAECLLVDGPRLIVTPAGKKALMAALDKQTGRTVWMTEPLAEDIATYSSPILFRHAGRRILANYTSAHGFGVDADSGKLLWTVPMRGPFKVNVTTPVYDAGRIFYVVAEVSGTCFRLQATAKGVEPEKAWTTPLDTCTGTVLIADGLLYGAGYEKCKSWLCLDWESGQIRYQSKSLKPGSAVYADGRLYCLGVDGRVALVRLTAQQFEILSQFQLIPEKTTDAWAHPVLLHGRLYLRYHDTLWCYDVRNKE